MSNKFFELLMNSIFANCLYGTGDRSSSCLMRPISVLGQRGELGSNYMQEPKSVAAAHALRSGVTSARALSQGPRGGLGASASPPVMNTGEPGLPSFSVV